MTTQVDAGTTDGGVDRARQRVHRLTATLLVAVLPWLIAPGRLQPDTKTDLVVSPARYLQRALWAWNDHTGIGELQNQAYGYLWPMGTVFLAGDTAGLPGWVTQRSWWTLLLVIAFVGAERLARRVAGVSTIPALLAGVVFALSPRVLTVLAEISVEVWPYALAPWLVLAAHRMVGARATARDRRAGAAVTGVLTVCLGGVNATVSLVALVPAVAWLLVAPAGRGRGRALCWWVVSAGAGALWWLGPLLVLGGYAYPFLDHIEVAATTTAVASVANVLRGAEHWIAYILTPGDHPTWQSGWILAQWVPSIVATTALAGLGLAGVVRLRERRSTDGEGGDADRAHLTRWCLGLVLVGVVTMTMGRTGAAHGVVAEPVEHLLDGVLAPVRNVHKADLLVRLPVALGVGLLAHWATRVERGAGPVVRQLVVVTTVLALVGSTAPVWLGRVGDAWAPSGIPARWTETAERVDALAATDGGTTLVLPGARTADFTWGRVTDEPLRALAESPVLVRAAAPLGHPGATRVLDRVDALTATGRSQPHLAEGLRRLGISRVVVRGGLSAALTTVDPRTVVATLEASPGLTRTWSHGEGREEISIWRLDDPAAPATVVPADAVVTAAASPEGWFALVAAGLLDPRSVMQQPGAERAADVRTDTLRWRALNSGRPPLHGRGPTLPAQDPRPALVGTRALTATGGTGEHPRRHGWTTRFHSGISGIDVSSSAASPFAPAQRGAGTGPAALVDGDADTAWVSGDTTPHQQITLTLAEPSAPRAVLVHEAWGQDLGRLTAVTVDGREGTRRSDSMTWHVPLDGSERDTVTIDLWSRGESATHAASPVGVREVELEPGPELMTGLVLPEGGPGPVLITRDPRAGDHQGEDPSELVRRTGRLPVTEVRADVRIEPGPAAQDLVTAPWRLGGSTLPDDFTTSSDLGQWPVAALDGDEDTRWSPASGVAEPVLAVDFGRERTVRTIHLDRAVGAVTVETDSERYVVPDGRVLTIPEQRTRRLTLTFSRPPGRAAWTGPEVTVPGLAGPHGRIHLDCSEAGAVGRGDSRIGLALTASREDLISGEVLPATACGDLPTGEGTITASAVPGLQPHAVALVPRDWSTPSVERTRSVDSHREHAGSWTFEVGAGERSLLVLGQGANDGWRAVTEEGDELASTSVDGWRQAFVVPAGHRTSVTVEFVPNRAHRFALLLGAVAAGVLLLWGGLELTLARRGRRDPGVAPVQGVRPPARTTDGGSRTRQGRRALVLGLAGTVGALVAGPVGVPAAVLGALVPSRCRALVVAVVLAVTGASLSVLGVAERQSAGTWVAQCLGTIILGVLVAALLRADPGAPGPVSDAPGESTTDGPARR